MIKNENFNCKEQNKIKWKKYKENYSFEKITFWENDKRFDKRLLRLIYTSMLISPVKC